MLDLKSLRGVPSYSEANVPVSLLGGYRRLLSDIFHII